MDVTLNGETRLHLILGDPIAQVKSPPALTAIMVARGANALLVPVHVAPADLDAVLAGIRVARNVDSVIFTVPHKIAGLAFADEAADRARLAGAANVVRRGRDGRWRGDNTDGLGYMDGIAARGFDVAGRTALLVGAGGAGAAIAYEILARGASRLRVHDIDTTRRDRVIARLDERFPGRATPGDADPTGADLVANATPLGMRAGDPLPVDATRLVASQFVADVITRPEISPLLVEARRIGCATMPGAGMFEAQARILVDRMLELETV